MNNSENIKKMAEQLYTDRDQNGDVIFLVESERIRAHRNVLAALSPKYKAQFYGPNPDQGEIRIPNVSAVAFKEFLQFFYKESVNLTMGNIETVLDLAKQSLNDEFAEICVDFLKKSIKTSNVCFVYRLAILYDIDGLLHDCEQQISSKTTEVFGSNDFMQCDRDVLLHILKLNTLNCTEINTFNACIAWARADCRQKSLDETKPEHLRVALDDAIYQVRFASINAQEFAAALHGSLNVFFTAEELVELFSITSKVNDFKSQKFNQTPRNIRNQRTPFLKTLAGTWSLECDRFEHMKNGRINTEGDFNSEISCDKPIRLYGLAIGFNLKTFKSSGCIEIKLARDNKSFVTKNVKCKYYEEKTETMIIFEDPIDQLNALEISFSVSVLKVNHELVLNDQIDVDNNKFICSGELVTRFFFDNL